MRSAIGFIGKTAVAAASTMIITVSATGSTSFADSRPADLPLDLCVTVSGLLSLDATCTPPPLPPYHRQPPR